MMHFKTFRTTLVSAISDDLTVVFDFLILQDKHNIRTLSLNIKLICTCKQVYLFLKLVQINFLFSYNVHILYIYIHIM